VIELEASGLSKAGDRSKFGACGETNRDLDSRGQSVFGFGWLYET